MKNNEQIRRDFVTLQGREAIVVRDFTAFNSDEAWKELQGIRASEITHRDEDNEILDGLVIKGYEMKWGETNANGERYEKTAFDKFIQSYFVERGLNMPVDINHEGSRNYNAICGRVLYIETNSVGFYFVVYIPRGYAEYGKVKFMLEQGLLQGFSKEGWATDWEFIWNKDGTLAYELIKEIQVVSVSLVSTPANGLRFEKSQEVKNVTQYVNKIIKTAQPANTMDALFNV